MDQPIYTIAVLKAKVGRLEALKSALEALAAETRQEAGAIAYFFVHDQNHDLGAIVSFEKWRSAEDEAAHWRTPHLQAAIAAMKDILDGDPIIHRGPLVV